MEHEVGIIGHFGANGNFCDGQTVKTKNLAELLGTCDNIRLTKVDTFYFKTNSVKLLLDTLKCMMTCDHIFLLVSVKGMRFYLPFLFYLNKFTKKHIYHYIIGSELLEMVKQTPRLVTYLNALDRNWFEYESGTRFLRQQGVTNVSTLANFKLLRPVDSACAYEAEDHVYRFCTFSRVMEEKGITEAIEAVRRINKAAGETISVLDIYGPVEAGYQEQFEHLLEKNHDMVSYKGTVDSKHSVKILKQYYALLFPTRWAGEGVPGTIIDAFAAGIPVVASDWNANKELITSGVQGLLYPNENMETLEDAIMWSIQHPEAMAQMRENSRKAYVNYMPETILRVILEEMKI